jgi:hypothetical protein
MHVKVFVLTYIFNVKKGNNEQITSKQRKKDKGTLIKMTFLFRHFRNKHKF